jgi:hypothetical protein
VSSKRHRRRKESVSGEKKGKRTNDADSSLQPFHRLLNILLVLLRLPVHADIPRFRLNRADGSGEGGRSGNGLLVVRVGATEGGDVREGGLGRDSEVQRDREEEKKSGELAGSRWGGGGRGRRRRQRELVEIAHLRS